MLKKLGTALILLVCAACGSGGSGSSGEGPGTNLTVPNGTRVPFTFNFEIEIDSIDNSFDFSIPYEGDYEGALYVESSGAVSMLASDFPKIVYRICKSGSTTTLCDYYYDSASDDIDLAGNDIDIVIDACGKSVADKNCGDSDSTTFSGTLSSTGSLVINNLQFRIRFFIATASTNGYNSSSSASGLDVNGSAETSSIRLSITRLTTGTVTINGGDNLSETGSKVANQAAVLVGGGVIPSSIPSIGNSYFIGIIDLNFSNDPLSLLK